MMECQALYRNKRLPEFASLIVDYDRKRIAEVVNGKTVQTMKGSSHFKENDEMNGGGMTLWTAGV